MFRNIESSVFFFHACREIACIRSDVFKFVFASERVAQEGLSYTQERRRRKEKIKKRLRSTECERESTEEKVPVWWGDIAV